MIATHHVAGGTENFFREVQHCYEHFAPSTPANLRLPTPADLDTTAHPAETAHTARFGPIALRRHEWDLTYTTSDYLKLPRTYSGHRALPPQSRHGLLRCIAELIDGRCGGRVTKRYLTELRVSRRVPGPGPRTAARPVPRTAPRPGPRTPGSVGSDHGHGAA